MDGNRRYAKKESVAKIEGHKKGFEKLAETLRWCWEFGITELTVYVFSIENFKRPQEEVNGLIDLAKEKFQKLLQELDRLEEHGVCVQIIGDWSLIPADLKPLMAKVMLSTRHHTKAKLNVAFAYTARNEIVRGIKSVEAGLLDNQILPEDVSEELLTQTFQLLPAQPLDLLVRTSGERRLSDFLLWQSAETVLCFTEVLWPEFTIWHLMGAIFNYQVNIMSMKSLNLKQSSSADLNDLQTEACKRQAEFLEQNREKMWEVLEKEAALVS